MYVQCTYTNPERPLFLRDEKKCFALWVFRLVITRKCQQVLFALTLPLQLVNALFFDEVNREKTEDFFFGTESKTASICYTCERFFFFSFRTSQEGSLTLASAL